jgi:protein-S-isoprenylcysteine O-methyltransferase Ste14
MIPDIPANHSAVKQAPKRAIAIYLTREALSVAGMVVILFWPAGKLNWGMGWALVALWTAWVAAMAWVVIRRSPELLLERLGARKGSQKWDAVIQPTLSLLQAARCIVGGFDQRNGWSSGISPSAQVAFLIIGGLGAALFVWAAASNKFFSQVVRIQDERGHAVAQGGPYRWIRHPGYAGSILMEIGAPLILGSWWALVPSSLLVLLMVVRTVLEERTLRSGLPGYAEYAQRVKYRLVPGIW